MDLSEFRQDPISFLSAVIFLLFSWLIALNMCKVHSLSYSSPMTHHVRNFWDNMKCSMEYAIKLMQLVHNSSFDLTTLSGRSGVAVGVTIW